MSEKEEESKLPDEQNPRREFLKDLGGLAAGAVAATAIGATAGVAAAQSGGHSKAVSLTKPITWKLVSSDSKKTGPVTVAKTVFELYGGDGAKYHFNCFTERIEHEDGHETVVFMQNDQFANASDTSPQHSTMQTLLTSVKYGEQGVDVRKDRVTIRAVTSKGLQTMPEMIVKVPVPNPLSGLSDQEAMDKILSEKLR